MTFCLFIAVFLFPLLSRPFVATTICPPAVIHPPRPSFARVLRFLHNHQAQSVSLSQEITLVFGLCRGRIQRLWETPSMLSFEERQATRNLALSCFCSGGFVPPPQHLAGGSGQTVKPPLPARHPVQARLGTQQRGSRDDGQRANATMNSLPTAFCQLRTAFCLPSGRGPEEKTGGFLLTAFCLPAARGGRIACKAHSFSEGNPRANSPIRVIHRDYPHRVQPFCPSAFAKAAPRQYGLARYPTKHYCARHPPFSPEFRSFRFYPHCGLFWARLLVTVRKPPNIDLGTARPSPKSTCFHALPRVTFSPPSLRRGPGGGLTPHPQGARDGYTMGCPYSTWPHVAPHVGVPLWVPGLPPRQT